MRPVLFISLLLLLSTLFHEAQGRHLRKGGDLPTRNHKTNENGSVVRSEGSNVENKFDACKDEVCSSSSSRAMKRKVSRATKVSHHWLPSIHEDYYGFRAHIPRHH
nr:uncharacterized protein LOC109174816 [Ipomoea trifida]